MILKIVHFLRFFAKINKPKYYLFKQYFFNTKQILIFSKLRLQNPFHIVEPSIWPFFMSIALTTLLGGLVSYMHMLPFGLVFFIVGLLSCVNIIFFWVYCVFYEGFVERQHTKSVRQGLRFGFILFIISEIMFFVSIFWSYFHIRWVPVYTQGWPPIGFIPSGVDLIIRDVYEAKNFDPIKIEDPMSFFRQYMTPKRLIYSYVYPEERDDLYSTYYGFTYELLIWPIVKRMLIWWAFFNCFGEGFWRVESIKAYFGGEKNLDVKNIQFSPFVDLHVAKILDAEVISELFFKYNPKEGFNYEEIGLPKNERFFHETRGLLYRPTEAKYLWCTTPLFNTIVLLASGAAVTWAHYGLRSLEILEVFMGLWNAIWLGLVFTIYQLFEYKHLSFSINDGIYGSLFYLATGFHGFHVLIGTIMLIVNFIKVWKYVMDVRSHVGFESAIWYWHFVDLVWLFLFIFIYIDSWSIFPRVTSDVSKTFDFLCFICIL